MATNDVLLVTVIDQSGSMEDHKKDTIDGYNRFIEEQVAQPGDTAVLLVVFDSAATVRFAGGAGKLMDPLGSQTNPYSPAGGTALYDAFVLGIDEGEKWLKDNPTFDGQVIHVTFTDGAENSSKKVALNALNDLRRRKAEDDGWQFVFMGLGGAAWTEGKTMAFAPASRINYEGDQVAMAYSGLSNSVAATRSSGLPINTAQWQSNPS
jgi:hypothetical protein